MPRPWAVVLAVRLLWLALGMDLLGTVLEALEPNPEFSRGEILLITLISSALILGVYLWLIFGALRGRNWSRIVLLVLSILGLATNYFLSLDPDAEGLPAHLSAIYWVATLADIAGLVLLFTPGANAWYRSMRAS